MYSYFCNDWEVKSTFQQEYVTLWPSFLGLGKLHLLDEVTEFEWGRFNYLLKLIFKEYKIQKVNHFTESLLDVEDINSVLSLYKDSMNKDASKFSQFVLPELNCIITEEWDFTYIVWHENNGAVNALSTFISQADLYHFS